MSTTPSKPPVLVPRQDPHDRLVTALKQDGFGVIHAALTTTRVLPGADLLADPAVWQVDWLVITSATTVRLLPPEPLAAARAAGMRVAAVGRATARALARAGVEVDLVPDDQSGAGLVDSWRDAGASVLLPASALAAPTVPDGLAAKGCRVERVELYTTEAVDELPPVVAQAWPSFAAVVVTSSSVARSLCSLVADADLVWTRQRPVAIGGPTADTLAGLGHPAAAVADSPTPEGIVAATNRALTSAAPNSTAPCDHSAPRQGDLR